MSAVPESNRQAGAGATCLEDALPTFMAERNERALSAGLRIEKQTRAGRYSTTWYEGTKAEILAAGFEFEGNSFPKKGCRSYLWVCFSPFAYHGVTGATVKALGPNLYRLSIANEQIPEEITVIEPGLVMYEGVDDHQGHILVYEGDIDRLIALNIAPPIAKSKEYSRYRNPEDPNRMIDLWTCTDKRGVEGVARYIVFVDNWAKYREIQGAQKLPDLPTAEALRERMSKALSFGTYALVKEIEARNGNVYRLTQDSIDEIGEALGRLKAAIEDAEIVTIRLKTVDLSPAVSAAKADLDFSRFIARVAAPPSGSEGS